MIAVTFSNIFCRVGSQAQQLPGEAGGHQLPDLPQSLPDQIANALFELVPNGLYILFSRSPAADERQPLVARFQHARDVFDVDAGIVVEMHKNPFHDVSHWLGR